MCKAKYILPILAISAGLSFTSAIANTAGINLENPLIQVSAVNPAATAVAKNYMQVQPLKW